MKTTKTPKTITLTRRKAWLIAIATFVAASLPWPGMFYLQHQRYLQAVHQARAVGPKCSCYWDGVNRAMNEMRQREESK